MGDRLAEVGPRLLNSEELIAERAQVVNNIRAVAEELREELEVTDAGDRAGDPVVDTVEGVHPLRHDDQVQ